MEEEEEEEKKTDWSGGEKRENQETGQATNNGEIGRSRNCQRTKLEMDEFNWRKRENCNTDHSSKKIDFKT